MLDPVPGRSQVADLERGAAEAVHDRLQGGVADGMETGLQTGPGAGRDVPADLVGVEVGMTAGRLVDIRRTEAGGVAAERAVGEQVPGGAGGAELPSPLDGVQLAPVADPLDAVFHREQVEQVLFARDARTGALVHAGDAERRGPVEHRPLRGDPLRRGECCVGRFPDGVVRGGPDQAVRQVTGQGTGRGTGGQQGAAGDR